MSPSPGESLLHYKIERKLGEGGMGEVWLATDTRLQRSVALKFLGRKAALEPQARERLAREARAASALNHPNILAIYAVETVAGADFIAMEYADGQPLDQWVATHSPEFDRLLDLALQVGDALAAAHGKGIVHRDIKPSNVMVSPDGRAQVLDFGLAKVSSEPQLTRTGSTLGTLAYMAPEQVKGQEIDARSDQFSFGALLYELISGASPFARNANTAAILHAILNENPPPLSKSIPEIPGDLDTVIARALAKDRDHRYPDMDALLGDLRGLRAGRPVSAASGPHSRMKIAIPIIALVAGISWLASRTSNAALETTPAAQPSIESPVAAAAKAAPIAARPSEPVPRFGQRLLSTLGVSPHSGTLNMDGSMLAYVKSFRGVDQLFVAAIDDGDPQRVTSSTQSVQRPRWQPGGSLILYQHSEVSTGWLDGEVLVVSALGGEPRILIRDAIRASWSHDGEQIIFERAGQIWMADAAGQEQHILEGFPTAIHPLLGQMPALSPDGQMVAFFRSERGPAGRLWIGNLDGSDLRPISSVAEMARNPSFTSDGRWIIHSSERGGPRLLWRTSTAPDGPHEAQPITSGTGSDSDPCLADGDGRILFTNARNESVLQVWDPTRSDSEPRVLRASRSPMLFPSWSPDGTRIVMFGEGRNAATELHTIAADGSDLTQITHSPDSTILLMPRWSMDGGSIYYFREAESDTGYYRVPAAGGTADLIAADWRMLSHPFPALTPDGRSVLCAQFVAGELPTTFLRDLETGVQEPFPASVFRPNYSGTGDLIAGEWPPGSMVLIDTETYARTRLGAGQLPRFAGDGESIYFLLAEDEQWQLWITDRRGENRTMLRELGQMYEVSPWIDVSRYGEVVWAEQRSSPRELWVLDQK